MKVTIVPIVIGAFDAVTKGLLKARGFGSWRTSGDHPNRHYWERPEYWEESWRLEETCCHSNSSENHQLTLMWKTLKKCIIIKVDFTVSADHRVKMKENKKRDKYLDLVRELKKKKKRMEHEGDSDTNCNCRAWYSHWRVVIGIGGLGDKKTSGDHPNYSIVEIG